MKVFVISGTAITSKIIETLLKWSGKRSLSMSSVQLEHLSSFDILSKLTWSLDKIRCHRPKTRAPNGPTKLKDRGPGFSAQKDLNQSRSRSPFSIFEINILQPIWRQLSNITVPMMIMRLLYIWNACKQIAKPYICIVECQKKAQKKHQKSSKILQNWVHKDHGPGGG